MMRRMFNLIQLEIVILLLYNSGDVGINTTIATERSSNFVKLHATTSAIDKRPPILLQELNNPSLANKISFMCLHQGSR